MAQSQSNFLNHVNSKFYWLYSIAHDTTIICGSDNQIAKHDNKWVSVKAVLWTVNWTVDWTMNWIAIRSIQSYAN